MILSLSFKKVHSQNQEGLDNLLQKDLIEMCNTLKSLTTLAANEQNDPLIVLYTNTFYSVYKRIKDSHQVKEDKDFFDSLIKINEEKKANFDYSISLDGLKAPTPNAMGFRYSLDLNTKPNKKKKVRKKKKSKPVIKMMKIPGVDNLAKKIRDTGLEVVVINDDEGSVIDQDTTNYNVIWVGREVKPSVIAQVLQITKIDMPWLRYIFIQSPNDKFDNQIFLGAYHSWIDHLGLKELKEKDFEELSNPKLSKNKIHEMINNYTI